MLIAIRHALSSLRVQALAQCQLESEAEMRESKSKGAGVPGKKGTADESF